MISLIPSSSSSKGFSLAFVATTLFKKFKRRPHSNKQSDDNKTKKQTTRDIQGLRFTMLGDEVKQTPKLSSCKVFVRLRPKVYGSGCGHDQDDGIGYEVAKSLEAFTQDSITLKTQYMFSDGHNRYDFPTKVFPPEVSQVEVFQSILPQLCKRLLTEDVLLLAYGQTGTGMELIILISGMVLPKLGKLLWPRFSHAFCARVCCRQDAYNIWPRRVI